MRAVLTRVKSASVSVDGNVIGQIGPGFLILLGITHDDTEAQAVKLADKLTGLRIFEDEDGKMNRGLETIPLYEKFVSLCREKGIHTETGEFGAEMLVESVNDGPLTLVVDTDQLNA